MDIVRKLQQVAIILDDNAFVPTLPPARLRPVGDYYAPPRRGEPTPQREKDGRFENAAN
jgi:hypothetical protein